MEKQSAQCISQSCTWQVRGISFAKITSDGHLVHLTGSDLHLLCRVNKLLPIQVTERSKARVCGRLLVGITGSNPSSGTDVCFVCCHLVVFATGRSLVQRSPSNCGVSLCGLESSRIRRPWPALGCCAREKNRQ